MIVPDRHALNRLQPYSWCPRDVSTARIAWLACRYGSWEKKKYYTALMPRNHRTSKKINGSESGLSARRTSSHETFRHPLKHYRNCRGDSMIVRIEERFPGNNNKTYHETSMRQTLTRLPTLSRKSHGTPMRVSWTLHERIALTDGILIMDALRSLF